MNRLLCSLLIGLLLSPLFGVNAASAPQQSVHLIPRKKLFGPLEKQAIQVSPDCKVISYFQQNKEGEFQLYLMDVQQGTIIKEIGGLEQYSNYYWIDEEYLALHKDNNGDENYGVFLYHIQQEKLTLVYQHPKAQAVIHGLKKSEDKILVFSNNQRSKRYKDLYTYNIETKEIKLLFKNKKKFINLLLDNDYNLIGGVKMNLKGDSKVWLHRDGKWKLFTTVLFEDRESTYIIGADESGREVYYMDSRDRDKNALKVLNMETLEEKVVSEGQQSDIAPYTFSSTTHRPQAVFEYFKTPSPRVIDESISDDLSFLGKQKEGFLKIVSRSKDDMTWVVTYLKSDKIPMYYRYDKKDKKLTHLLSQDKTINKYPWVKKKPVVIEARDGLQLVSYLSLPLKSNHGGLKRIRPLPLVLLVHGGPANRDECFFETQHQWLANRGYAVLSVNFRGSKGFGKQFLNASNGEWSRKMHDDLIDAVQWAIDQKIADPDKIAIMGASYGGYATLVGLTFTPKRFACGVDIFGISNLQTLIKNYPARWKPLIRQQERLLGGSLRSSKGKKQLKERSPLTYAHQIERPLLIIHGANDTRVKQVESEQFIKAMDQNNIPSLYALYHNEGHGIRHYYNLLSYAALIEHFLASVLGGEVEPISKRDFERPNLSINGEKVQTLSIEEIFTQFQKAIASDGKLEIP